MLRAWRISLRNYSQLAEIKKVYGRDEDKRCFEAVLHTVLHRISVKLWYQIHRGTPSFAGISKFSDALECDVREYNEALGLPLELGEQFDPSGEITRDPHMLNLIEDHAEKKKRAEGEALKSMHALLRDVICHAEKALFAGQPNIRELQQNARLLATRTTYKACAVYEATFGYVHCLTRSIIQDGADLEPYIGYVPDERVRLCEETLIRAKVAAKAGGIPEFDGGLLPLFNFQLPHSHRLVEHHRQLVLSRAKSKSRSLDTRWTTGSEGDTIVVHAEGAESKDDVRLEKSDRTFKVFCGGKSRKLLFPSGTLPEQAHAAFDESTRELTLTVPPRLTSAVSFPIH